jgi:glycosyltransferase involved in cell wall biosynthesis
MSPALPKVTVIVPVRNGERFLAAALQSVRDQHYPDLDIVVVDGGSVDRSCEIARSFAGVRLLQQAGRGLSDAWNTGVRAAEGQLVAFLDSDDLWVPDTLAARVRHLCEQDGQLGSTAKAMFFLEPGFAVPRGFNPDLLDIESIAPIPGTFLARKELFDLVGLFDTDLRIAADVDLMARIKDRGIALATFPELVLRKRVHDDNLSSDAAHGNRELLDVLRRSIARQRAAGTG